MTNEQRYFRTQVELLEQLIQKIERNQEHRLNRTLRVSKNGTNYRYYQRFPKEVDPSGKYHYIPKENTELIRQLAQQEYEESFLKKAKGLLSNAKGHLKSYDDRPLRELLHKQHPGRQIFITPLLQDDDTFIEQWLQRPYGPGTISDASITFQTNRGEKVRSKSEKIIADYYDRMNIPYLYEYPLQLHADSRVITLHPDFTVLNTRTREQFFHEHFGMIDNPEYADNLLKKLELYAKNQIYPGVQLLITMESRNHPLNTDYLETLLKNYLL